MNAAQVAEKGGGRAAQAPQTHRPGAGSAQSGQASSTRGKLALHAAQTSSWPQGAAQNAQFCGSARWQNRVTASHARVWASWRLSNFLVRIFDNGEGLIDTPVGLFDETSLLQGWMMQISAKSTSAR
jgi:hypothetical protein